MKLMDNTEDFHDISDEFRGKESSNNDMTAVEKLMIEILAESQGGFLEAGLVEEKLIAALPEIQRVAFESGILAMDEQIKAGTHTTIRDAFAAFLKTR